MKSNQESAPTNKALDEMSAVIGLSQAEVDDCAERWKALYRVDIRSPLPAKMSHLENDMLYLTSLRRILETYKRGLRKKEGVSCGLPCQYAKHRASY